MNKYQAKVSWERNEQVFTDKQYSRAHQWAFSGGAVVAATASPHIVPLPYSVAENIDPEEAFVASLSSCHMLFFLSIAADRKIVIDRYEDNAFGILGKNEMGKLAMTKVVLRPKINYLGDALSKEEENAIHHLAHAECFIANSVKTHIEIESV